MVKNRKVLMKFVFFYTVKLDSEWTLHKQFSRSVFIKRCYENMQQIYRKTSMSKCDLKKVAKQLY